MKSMRYLALWASLLLVGQSHAFDLNINAQSVQVGQSITIQLERDDARTACGVELKYGDGNTKILRFEENVKIMAEAYVYKYPGNYKVELDGKMIFRGLGSTFHCVGLVKSKQLTVDASAQLAPQAALAIPVGPVVAPVVQAPTPAAVQPAAMFAHRRALVIGNDSYKTIKKLENAREDAKAMGENLASVGYQVTMRLDVTEKEMKTVIRNFASQVEGGDEVFFFFAGHGVQLGAANYLLPTDIAGENEAQVKDEAIQLQRILDDMAEKKA
ncbi:MAG: hypothetical protein RLY82_1173, partial [Pseudomonadota bacterium]